VDQAVLVDADVGEGPEAGDIGDDRRQHHARPQVLETMDAGGIAELDEGCAGVTARFCQGDRVVAVYGRSPT
jgi:hypothetical protein